MFSGPASTALTNDHCSPTGFHWMFDTYSQSVGGVKAMIDSGGKSWYFITVDYAFGHSLEKNAGNMVKKLGGTVVGRSEERTSELQSLMRISYAVFCLKKKKPIETNKNPTQTNIFNS